jgi:hypothetical protein
MHFHTVLRFDNMWRFNFIACPLYECMVCCFITGVTVRLIRQVAAEYWPASLLCRR